MAKPSSPQPFARVLAADPTLAAWNAKRAHEELLLRAIRRALPRPLAERVFVADASAPLLTLSTASGAIATVVRQRSPDLLAELGREGWKFTAIRVRVQPRQEPQPMKKNLQRQWDSNSRRPLGALAAELPEGPLRTALTRFLRRAG